MSDADFAGPDEEKDRNFVTALARGLEVLRSFRPNEAALTNTDFAERTGLPKPTVSRLTYTLGRLEYLVADPRTGTYRLGPGVLQLGFGVLAGLDIAERAAAPMRELANGPNSYVTVALGERHRLDVVYVAVQTSREDVALTMHVGSRLPLFFSAIGRAILVGMDDEERAAVLALAAAEKPEQAAQFATIAEGAQEEFARDGFLRGYGEWRSDVNGIAVPVRSLDGRRLFGMNVGGPSFHVRKRQLETHYARALAAAAELLNHGG